MNLILQAIGAASVLVVQFSNDSFIKFVFSMIVIATLLIITINNRKK